MIRISLIITTLALLSVYCIGCSCNGRSGSKQSSGEDSVSHSSQRVFYVVDRRGDSFLISSLDASIIDEKMMWYDATMEPRAYAMEDYKADSLSISFKFTKISWCHNLEKARLWAEGETKEEYAITDISPFEEHTLSRYNRYLWRWQTAPGVLNGIGYYFMIDSTDVVASGYMTYTDFFDTTKDYRQVDDMRRTFYGIGSQNGIDTTERVRIDGKQVVWKGYQWSAESDSTRVYDLKEVLMRNTDDVVRLFVEGKKNEIFFVYRSNENPLLWEDCMNVDCYYIDSVDVVKSGLKIK